jgi:hypothetical protein
MRWSEHHQRGAAAQRVQEHLASALGDRRERQHPVALADLEAIGEGLESHLLELGGERCQLRRSGGPGGERDLNYVVALGRMRLDPQVNRF